jgi:capsular exopolysaccharide synthesis family protein
MSRIEEALRRAAAGGPAHTVAVDDTVASAEQGRSLTSYPSETRQEGPHTPEARRPARSVIARSSVEASTEPRAFPAALEGKLILSDAPPLAVEQYRRLAASVHELQVAHGTKTLMVTSAIPREGKTLTVTNLALTLSESYGRRVLLIDADLRRPSLHEVFRLPNAKGLSDGLRSETGELSLLPVTPLLSVLPAGRPDRNPMGALTSDRMEILLKEAASVFDWVLLDAPPAGMMPDAHLLARLTDGVIFVIAAGTTPYELVDRAVSEVGRETIVGTVLNRISEESMPATSYYAEYYQSHQG